MSGNNRTYSQIGRAQLFAAYHHMEMSIEAQVEFVATSNVESDKELGKDQNTFQK
jgi:hypothetical protein